MDHLSLSCLFLFWNALHKQLSMIADPRTWIVPESTELKRTTKIEAEKLKLVSEGCDPISKEVKREAKKVSSILEMGDANSRLEADFSAARGGHEGAPKSEDTKNESTGRKKYLVVVGINTAFSSRRRRDAVRATWMPQDEKRKKLEEEKGIIIRFVIGHSATIGGVLDRAILAEELKHGDFLRLVSLKTASIHRMHEIGSGPCSEYPMELNLIRGVKYHEPEYWKFGEPGNRYFRHATGQLYAISRDLATYIEKNEGVLHKYANEDVSLGSWFIGLDVQHVDDRRLCCGTPPDCEWKAQAGNICVASFDWSCSGICRPVERMKYVHDRCGESKNAIWAAAL
ncbi:LOW QUALITY PROTEIN: Glycosyl transferase, family 31 [Dillenia turbinata]|uniref:Hexosyltransferase n=1 Tax=Dillenia turbinata TaxID=194707 RepID=A0AAN8Z0X4_9MAGN